MRKMAKRMLAVLLCMLLVFGCIFSVGAVSVDEITAPSAILVEAETGKVLFEKESHQVRACASITKVMTMILVMEAIDEGKLSMEDTITSSAHAASMGGSDIWLEEGEVMTVHDLIKATMVASANDAAVALAEEICGSEDAFVEKMNQKAKELGMNETTFKNCNGLDEDGHLTSAYDVALMSRELIKHKEIFEFTSIWMDYLRDGKTQIVNTNKLLKSYKGITGLKTGTTSQAGSCISATATRDGLTLVAVVLGSATGQERFTDASALLDYGFANYCIYTPKFDEEIPEINVKNGMQSNLKAQANISGNFVIEKGKSKEVTYKLSVEDEVEAPVNKGDKVGTLTFYIGKEKLKEYPVVATHIVDKMDFSSVFALLFEWFVQV
ncbi:MAG: D-alanyl-D-alanine carboxypeptidase family protein [Acutalibacteraceae bacterium]|nr:D-alanyl-D-alanine carboxypeptidase family protein [Acutalibacteraceae bacterium]